jgi:hypothetical protein
MITINNKNNIRKITTFLEINRKAAKMKVVVMVRCPCMSVWKVPVSATWAGLRLASPQVQLVGRHILTFSAS